MTNVIQKMLIMTFVNVIQDGVTLACGEQEDTDCNDDLGGTAYQTSCGCIGGDTGIDECPDEEIPTEPVNTERIWYLDYDSDGYHGSTYEAADKPGDKWKTTTSGIDCDDARSQYTTVCCTKTCESGYKLNIDNCECIELDPCFDSINDLDTSNAFDTNTIIHKLEGFLSDFGIETDVIDFLKESNLFDPSKLSENIQSYIKASDYLSNTGDALGIASDIGAYLNEPQTENLLKVSFDIASLSLPPGTSLAISFLDLFENRDGKTIIEQMLKKASDEIEKLLNCNLGKGIHGLIF